MCVCVCGVILQGEVYLLFNEIDHELLPLF